MEKLKVMGLLDVKYVTGSLASRLLALPSLAMGVLVSMCTVLPGPPAIAAASKLARHVMSCVEAVRVWTLAGAL